MTEAATATVTATTVPTEVTPGVIQAGSLILFGMILLYIIIG